MRVFGIEHEQPITQAAVLGMEDIEGEQLLEPVAVRVLDDHGRRVGLLQEGVHDGAGELGLAVVGRGGDEGVAGELLARDCERQRGGEQGVERRVGEIGGKQGLAGEAGLLGRGEAVRILGRGLLGDLAGGEQVVFDAAREHGTGDDGAGIAGCEAQQVGDDICDQVDRSRHQVDERDRQLERAARRRACSALRQRAGAGCWPWRWSKRAAVRRRDLGRRGGREGGYGTPGPRSVFADRPWRWAGSASRGRPARRIAVWKAARSAGAARPA